MSKKSLSFKTLTISNNLNFESKTKLNKNKYKIALKNNNCFVNEITHVRNNVN